MWSNYKKALFVNSAGSMETNGLAIMDYKVFAYTENTIDDLLSLFAEMENGLRITIDEWKVIN